ncbi:MAG: hypothetical protein LBQ69_01765 [Treponema sp.]|nr:hypothetical protein [Treponema sp.]
MKRYCLLFLAVLVLAACAGQRKRIIIRPDPGEDRQQKPVDSIESWQVIESQSGQGDDDIPDWVYRYYVSGIHGIEALDRYSDKYVFIGETRGGNMHALRQWANGFTVQHDLPRLVAARVEHRLVSPASLYPDDEYGQYFEMLIKAVSNEEFPEAVKEETFWVKRRMVPASAEDGDNPPQAETATELYEFLVLISIDGESLKNQLREIMAGIQTKVPPTRDQAASISRIRQAFFVGF